MIPKTEPAENIPKSTSPPTMDFVVRDLRSLEKSFILIREKGQNELKTMQTKVKRLEFENSAAQSELEDMKSKIIFLENQNSKLKSDLEASEYYKNLYYNQYHQNGREFPGPTITINKLNYRLSIEKLKVEKLKSKLASILPKTEKSDESDQSAEAALLRDVMHFGDLVDNAPEWTRSKLSPDEGTSDETSNDEHHEKMKDQKSSGQQKRKLRSESENENLPKSKKSCWFTAPLSPFYW